MNGGETVLVVDDEDDIRAFLEVTLKLGGFEVISASDGEEAIDAAVREQPDLVVMDVMMPKLDGFSALNELRQDGRTSHIPVILLTAKSQQEDKIDGFAAGADDYITKPFDPDELVARVQATLRRAGQMRTMSPLTGLPGNVRIDQEVERRINEGEEFAFLYADLNSFKAVNDHYGPGRGDEVLKAFANLMREIVSREGEPDSFVGHLGGDDFVVITGMESYESIAEGICRGFDEMVTDFYDEEDLARGYIEIEDRRGVITRYGPVSVSIGIAVTAQRDMAHPAEVVEVATEMKHFAKSHGREGRSNWATDRREG